MLLGPSTIESSFDGSPPHRFATGRNYDRDIAALVP
jgi:hypothetical protein